MKIIISPAKKMRREPEDPAPLGLPVFLEDAERLRNWLRSLSYAQLKKLWACNNKIAEQNVERLKHMDLRRDLTPALLSYDGIQYQYMAPAVFEDGHFDYVQEHLRILSGFYGVVRPMDGVTPYRLEMQAKAAVDGCRDLYEYWGDRLYLEVMDESRVVIDLASKEYSRCVEAHLRPGDRFVSCVFGELENGKPVQKGVYAKMARGEMVRFMAERHIEDPEELKEFDVDHYRYSEELSKEDLLVFVR
ncbi:MAG: peroxide stress protein YaaA [Lachnospiraceae bacterium]|nr:peroxide stress protein YaaA [Lachnospiraceae bacterium]